MTGEIDLHNETLIPLSEVPARLPRRRGHRIHLQSVHRWARRGLRGVVLETVRVGHSRYTSAEALRRFLKATNPPTAASDYHEAIETLLAQRGL